MSENPALTNRNYFLEIYDSDTYEGPNPLEVSGVGLVSGPEHSQYLILKPTQPIQADELSIAQLAVRPHYDGDSIDHAVYSICTVGIAIGKPGATYEPGECYGFADFCFWKVGKITPANHGHS